MPRPNEPHPAVPTTPRLRPSPVALVGIVLLTLLANVAGFGNRFVQDDLSVIVENPIVHSISHPATFFTEPYWPKPYPPANYRPLATTAFALQWVAGDGQTWPFRVVSLGLLAGATVAVFLLLSRLVAPPAGWLGAAVFAVHPVHVEAAALGVNQGELAVGLLAALLTASYLRVRATGRTGPAPLLGLIGLYLVAVLSKETGLVLLALPIAAELLLVRRGETPRQRGRAVLPLVIGCLVTAALFAIVRATVLGGNVLGTPVAEALRGLSLGDRALTMLSVVPDWWRLLLWPATLRADYSPSQILAATTWGAPQTLGLVILAAWLGVVAWSWRRLPVVAFGLIVVAVGLIPVSNVLAPTGVVLAERTLFLPSVGLAVALAGVLDALARGWATRTGREAPIGESPRRLGEPFPPWLAAVIAVVIVLGASRTASRYGVWRDQITLWRQTAIDGPRSYRAHHALAQLLFRDGARAEAERHFQLAVEYSVTDWGPAADYADRLRDAGLCAPAAAYYQRALALEPGHLAVRNKLVLCLLALRRYREAGVEARAGIDRAGRPDIAAVFRRLAAVADSGEGTTR